MSIKRFFAKASPRSYVIFFLVFCVVFSAGAAFKQNHKIGINLSESLPQSFYIIELGGAFKKGDLIEFEYQSEDQRFFKDGMKMVKILAGVPGDKVVFNGQDFFINGEHFGEAKKLSMNGKTLQKNVSKMLGEDEYFVFAPHKDSFDSRYVSTGYISKKQILGKSVWEF